MITVKNDLSIPISLTNPNFSKVMLPQEETSLETGEYLLMLVDVKYGVVDLKRDCSIGIFSDSFADVATKSLTTDIPNILFFNPLPLPLRTFLNARCLDVLPPHTSKYNTIGFNVGDTLTFCTERFILGDFVIDDIFTRRINIGLY